MATTDTPSSDASPRLLNRGVVSLIAAVAVNVLILFATTASGAVEPFRPLNYPQVAILTAAGVIGATVVYHVIRRRHERPNRDFAIVATIVLVLSWIPDVTFVPTIPGATVPGIVVLMVMHLTTAAICYVVLTRSTRGRSTPTEYVDLHSTEPRVGTNIGSGGSNPRIHESRLGHQHSRPTVRLGEICSE